MLFRGVSEAKYMLYTSGQREFILQDYATLGIQYDQFMRVLLRNLRRNDDLMNFCKVAKTPPNDSYCFTYLQHYGAPTPYIDFTTDIYTALFYCFYRMSSQLSKSEIDHYCTLYYIKLDDIEYITERYMQEIHKDSPTERNLSLYSESTGGDVKSGMLSFDILQKMDIFYIDSKRKSGMFNDKKLIFRIPNRNMLVQNGVLLYNGSDSLPLERCMANKIHCIDIHKSLGDYIKKEYLHDCTKEKLFPDEYSIAQNTYAEFRKTLS